MFEFKLGQLLGFRISNTPLGAEHGLDGVDEGAPLLDIAQQLKHDCDKNCNLTNNQT